MAEFGVQLRRLREEKGMTQQTLADKMYVTRQTVSRWENGSRYPDLLTFRTLAEVLDVSTDTLLSKEAAAASVEVTPVTENPLLNNGMIALYGAVTVLYTVEACTACMHITDIRSALADNGSAVWSLATALTCAALFLYGLVMLLTGNDTPRRSGAVPVVFYALTGFSLLPHIDPAMGIAQCAFLGFFVLICLLGAFGAYRFFFFPDAPAAWAYAAVTASLYGIARHVMVIPAMRLMGSTMLPQVILGVLIQFTFLYRVFAVTHRRRAANALKVQ